MIGIEGMKTIPLFVFVLGVASAAGPVSWAKLGQKVILDCSAGSATAPLEWSHQGQLIIRTRKQGPPMMGDSGIITRAKLQGSKLQVRQLKESDAGDFMCISDKGSVKRTLLLVQAVAKPSLPLQLGGTASLQCRVWGPGKAQWRKPDNTLTGQSEVDLTPVSRSSQGPWACVITADGETHDETLNVTVREPAPPKPPPGPAPGDVITDPTSTDGSQTLTDGNLLMGAPWWLWASVGSSCLVLVLLATVAVILTLRLRRKKKRNLRMKHLKQPLDPRHFCQCSRPAAAAKPQRGRGATPSAPPKLRQPPFR